MKIRIGLPRFAMPRVRSLGAAVLVAALSIGSAHTALAQQLFKPASVADQRAAGPAAPSATTLSIRSRLVRIDPNVVAQNIAPTGLDRAANRAEHAAQLPDTVQIDLFPGISRTFKRTAVKAADISGYVWEGEAHDGGVQEVLLIVDNGQVTGRVQLKNQLFRIEPVGNGLHRIIEVDPRRFPKESPPVIVNTPAPRSEALPPDGPQATARTTIRVLVPFTRAARIGAGSSAKMLAEIKAAIALANQAYTRGGIPIYLALATQGTFNGTMEVNYAETSNFSTTLNALSANAGVFRAVHTKRNTVKADLVALMRKSGASCGIAWAPTTPSASTSNFGFSVTDRLCVSNLSFHHEIGHNMGALHDRYVHGGGGSVQLYNYGYVNYPKRVRTVMAYNDDCARRGATCFRINYFSSPTVRGRDGNVTGIVIGIAKGKSGAADNTRRLKETRAAIAAYR